MIVLAVASIKAMANPKPFPPVCEKAAELGDELRAVMEEVMPGDPHIAQIRAQIDHTQKTWSGFQEEFADDPELEPERRKLIAETLEMGEEMIIDLCQRTVEEMPAIIAEVRETKRLPLDAKQSNHNIEKQNEPE